MSSPLTGVASAFPLPNTCTAPDPGDPVRAEDVQIVAQILLNQDRSLETAFTPALSNVWTALRSPTINEISKLASSYNITIQPTDIGSQLIDLPNGVSISGVRVYIDPVTHVSLPGTKFTVSVQRRERATGTESSVLTFTEDPAASTGAYNVYHVIEVTFSDHVLDNASYIYYVRVDGENTPNEDNVQWFGSSVRVSMSSVSWL